MVCIKSATLSLAIGIIQSGASHRNTCTLTCASPSLTQGHNNSCDAIARERSPKPKPTSPFCPDRSNRPRWAAALISDHVLQLAPAVPCESRIFGREMQPDRFRR